MKPTPRLPRALRHPEGTSIDVTLNTAAYAAVVVLRGEHDVATRRPSALRSALCTASCSDLGDCEFIDSTIIETLLAYAQQLAAEAHLELEPLLRSVVARALELIKIRDAVYGTDSVDAPLGSADRAIGAGILGSRVTAGRRHGRRVVLFRARRAC